MQHIELFMSWYFSSVISLSPFLHPELAPILVYRSAELYPRTLFLGFHCYPEKASIANFKFFSVKFGNIHIFGALC
jgi:hypothetical protein